MIKLEYLNDAQKKALHTQRQRDKFAWMIYTGEFAYPENVDEFLYQKTLRESPKIYSERQLWADPVMHFSTIIDEMAGMLFGNESEANRQWVVEGVRNNLGDPEEIGNPSYTLMHNADGNETNWLVLMRKIAVMASVLKHLWIYVDGIKTVDGKKIGEATVHIIYPWDVVSEIHDKYGRCVEVLVKRTVDKRTSVKEEPKKVEEYLLFDLSGVSVYEDADLQKEISRNEYNYFTNTERNVRILPIFKVDLSLDREVGYVLSRKANVIFNLESVRDYVIRDVAFNFLELSANNEEFDAITDSLSAGTNILQRNPNHSSGHSFLQLDPSIIEITGKSLTDKVRAFYQSAFKEYSDSARMATATEITQKANSSINAFLTILSMTLDEAENQIFWRLTQIYNPDNTGVWADSSVKRSVDFAPVDIDSVIDRLMSRYVGERIPLGDEQLLQVIKMISKYDNWSASDAEIMEIVERLKAGGPNEPGAVGGEQVQIPSGVPHTQWTKRQVEQYLFNNGVSFTGSENFRQLLELAKNVNAS